MIKRDLLQTIIKGQKKGFITIIYGPRRIGKTVLLTQLQEYFKNDKIIVVNGDTEEARELLQKPSEVKLTNFVKDYDLIFIDEAQRIPNIGLSLKIIIDKFPNKKIIVTGSSSLELSKGVQENLTGRNMTYKLYPLSLKELTAGSDKYKIDFYLEDLMIYGGYPYLQQVGNLEEKQRYLKSLIDDYLFKDVLLLERIDNPDTFKKLAVLLSWQIGSEVSLNELARSLNIDIKTVSRYLNLLEKSFVIFCLGSYSTNLRKEVVKSKKYYFYDLGIRNALTGQFLPLTSRIDTGKLWENFMILEIMKNNEYAQKMQPYFFWRNYKGAEVDLITLNQSNLSAFEFKWRDKKYKTPKNFTDQYQTEVKVINKDNYKKVIGWE